MAAWLSLAALATALAGGARAAERPRLVLLLAIDQLRADRLDAALPGGLGRLAREGRVYPQAVLDHAGTETCAGHATMLTGRHPGPAGVPGNTYVDLAAAESRYCLGDAALDARVLGAPPGSNGRSPRNLRVTTLGDWLKGVDARARVQSVSGKDRSAIALGGHRADGAWWFSREDPVGFTTSTYYARALPDWVRVFNGADPPNDGWMAALPAEWEHLRVYDEDGLHPDDFAGESEAYSRTSPHPLRGEDAAGTAARAYASPFLDDATLDFAERLVREEDLGADAVPDVLAVSLSGMDVVGHLYGPFSQESRDALARLDVRLGQFLAFLEERAGEGRLLVALTSDHGVLPLPEWLELRGEASCPVAGGRVAIRDVGEKLFWALWREFSPTFSWPRNWLVYAGTRIGVDRSLAAEYGVDPEAVVARAEELLEEEPGVARVWTAAEIATAEGDAARLQRNSFDPSRSGDFVVEVAPGCLVHGYKTGTTHGSPHLYDRAVPLLFWGDGIAPARLDEEAATVDIAPTLARRLGVPTPGDLDGRALFE